jgi:hypothetical protein
MKYILPSWGGAMVHSDPQLTGFINLPVPKNNVKILWHKNKFCGEKAGTMGNGIAGNGKIAACTFNGLRDNLVIYDYNGRYLWHSDTRLNAVATASSPMVDINNRVIACDNKKILMIDPYGDGDGIVWESKIPKKQLLLIPISPTIVGDKTIIVPTNGPVYAFDARTGELLAQKYLGLGECGKRGYFSTINSACVNGDRVYISTDSTQRTKPHRGRLYAIDVNPEAENENEVLTEAWTYEFEGGGQASPMFIDDSIYFDGSQPVLGLLRQPQPHIYAITDRGDNGEEKWKNDYPHRTLFVFSKDPRGGFWYEDLRGKRLVRFAEEDGSIIEEILMKNLVREGLEEHMPMSCMTICDKKHPIMLISAMSLLHHQYVIAVDLNADNSVLWRVKIQSKYGLNYAGGQFTILKKDTGPCDPRLVFATYYDGVMAIGSTDGT